MLLKLKCFLFSILLTGYTYAQKIEKSSSDSNKSKSSSTNVSKEKKLDNPSKEKSVPKELIFKPTVGLGVGLLSFYGDIHSSHLQTPTVSRIAYELNVAQTITDYLQFNFYALRGKLGADENSASGGRNLNFESQITAGGVYMLYDFGNFLKKDRVVSPYITLGFEAFEFLSKTDLLDKYGNKYYYWPNGSIHNVPATDAHANTSPVIERDYTYETDVRTLNADGFGKYPENSFAVPVGIGFNVKVNEYFTFKMGTTMHYTFTDYIDGITQNSVGDRAGNSKKDKFMMSSISLHYNFGLKKKDSDTTEAGEEISDADLLALDKEDSDKDGVIDSKDSCQGTPAGVAVDIKGCPLDDDKDGVPNYADDEPNSPIGAYVDSKGVQLSDSALVRRYQEYMDSTGEFNPVVVHDHNGQTAYNSFYHKEYSVEIGRFKKGLPPELMTKFLSINDVASHTVDDSTTVYTSGKFDNSLDAEKRKQQLIADGMPDAKVVYKQNGVFHDAPVFKSNVVNPAPAVAKEEGNKKSIAGNNDSSTKKEKEEKENKTTDSPKKHNNRENKGSDYVDEQKSEAAANTPGLVLRVQLGAFHKRLPKSVFKDISDLIEIKTEDGLYKYTTGSFNNFDDAAKHKVNMLLKGYEGAFITAYKNGKRISINEAGATPIKKGDIVENKDNEKPEPIDKKQVQFKIQVGKFKNQPPDDKLDVFAKIKNVNGQKDQDGFTRYLAGSFNDYKQAEDFKNEITKTYGLKDAFVVAFYKGELISITEALGFLKQ